MLDLLTDYQVWASLLTLTALEIVLGIDNLIFLSIVSGRLPRDQQPAARRIGLALALLGRVALLFSLTWLIGLTAPILTLAGFDLSWRDVVLIVGGAFLIVKGTMETHHMLEGQEEGHRIGTVTFFSAIVQITLLDIVFALEFDHHRGRDDAAPPGDGYGCGDRHGHHAGGGRPRRQLREQASDGEDAGLVVPVARRRGADRGRDALPHPARLPLLRHRLLRRRRSAESAGGASPGPQLSQLRRLNMVLRRWMHHGSGRSGATSAGDAGYGAGDSNRVIAPEGARRDVSTPMILPGGRQR